MGNHLRSPYPVPNPEGQGRQSKGRGGEDKEEFLLFMQNKGPFSVLTSAALMLPLGRTRGRIHPPDSSGAQRDQRWANWV